METSDNAAIADKLAEMLDGCPPLSEAARDWLQHRLTTHGVHEAARNFGGLRCYAPHKHGSDDRCVKATEGPRPAFLRVYPSERDGLRRLVILANLTTLSRPVDPPTSGGAPSSASSASSVHAEKYRDLSRAWAPVLAWFDAASPACPCKAASAPLVASWRVLAARVAKDGPERLDGGELARQLCGLRDVMQTIQKYAGKDLSSDPQWAPVSSAIAKLPPGACPIPSASSARATGDLGGYRSIDPSRLKRGDDLGDGLHRGGAGLLNPYAVTQPTQPLDFEDDEIDAYLGEAPSGDGDPWIAAQEAYARLSDVIKTREGTRPKWFRGAWIAGTDGAGYVIAIWTKRDTGYRPDVGHPVVVLEGKPPKPVDASEHYLGPGVADHDLANPLEPVIEWIRVQNRRPLGANGAGELGAAPPATGPTGPTDDAVIAYLASQNGGDKLGAKQFLDKMAAKGMRVSIPGAVVASCSVHKPESSPWLRFAMLKIPVRPEAGSINLGEATVCEPWQSKPFGVGDDLARADLANAGVAVFAHGNSPVEEAARSFVARSLRRGILFSLPEESIPAGHARLIARERRMLAPSLLQIDPITLSMPREVIARTFGRVIKRRDLRGDSVELSTDRQDDGDRGDLDDVDLSGWNPFGPSDEAEQKVQEVAAVWAGIDPKLADPTNGPAIARAVKAQRDFWLDFIGKWRSGDKQEEKVRAVIADANAAMANVASTEQKKPVTVQETPGTVKDIASEKLSAARGAAQAIDDKASAAGVKPGREKWIIGGILGAVALVLLTVLRSMFGGGGSTLTIRGAR